NLSFTNVQSLVGGAGADILQGSTLDQIWNVTGAGSGNVAGTSFSGFEQLQGAANTNSTFIFSPGASLAQGVVGGAGGFNTMVLDGNFQTVTMAATDGHDGSVTLDGNTIDYAGLQPITFTGASNDVVIDLGASALGPDTATLSAGPVAGEMTLSSAIGTFESTTFDDPTQMLTINLQGDGDTVKVQSVDSGFDAGLTVDSGDGNTFTLLGSVESGTTGAVELASSISTGGNAVSITAGTITLDSGVTINTQSATGNSGNITLTGENITLNDGSGLIADASSASYSAGTVTLNVADDSFRALELPIAY